MQTFSGVEACWRQGKSEMGKPNASKGPTSPKPLLCVTFADFGCFCARLSASVMQRWMTGRRGEGGIKVVHILLSADNSWEPILLSVSVGLNKGSASEVSAFSPPPLYLFSSPPPAVGVWCSSLSAWLALGWFTLTHWAQNSAGDNWTQPFLTRWSSRERRWASSDTAS